MRARRGDHWSAGGQRRALARLDSAARPGSRLAAWSARSAGGATTRCRRRPSTTPLAARALTHWAGGAIATCPRRPVGRRASATLTTAARPATLATTEAATLTTTARPATLLALAGVGGRGRLRGAGAFGTLALW